jgi:hypothetical protein
MTTTFKELGAAVLTATPQAVYAPIANTQGAVHTASLWNPSGTPVVVDAFLVPPGGAATDATHVGRIQVPGAASVPFYDLVNMKLGPQSSIFASGLGVTMTLTGVENS